MEYPLEARCMCGRQSVLRHIDVTTYYKEKEITLIGVPSYLCLSFLEGQENRGEHVDFARVTRVQMHKKLKEAYEQGLDRVPYEETIKN